MIAALRRQLEEAANAKAADAATIATQQQQLEEAADGKAADAAIIAAQRRQLGEAQARARWVGLTAKAVVALSVGAFASEAARSTIFEVTSVRLDGKLQDAQHQSSKVS